MTPCKSLMQLACAGLPSRLCQGARARARATGHGPRHGSCLRSVRLRHSATPARRPIPFPCTRAHGVAAPKLRRRESRQLVTKQIRNTDLGRKGGHGRARARMLGMAWLAYARIAIPDHHRATSYRARPCGSSPAPVWTWWCHAWATSSPAAGQWDRVGGPRLIWFPYIRVIV